MSSGKPNQKKKIIPTTVNTLNSAILTDEFAGLSIQEQEEEKKTSSSKTASPAFNFAMGMSPHW